jgi:hypothetical protein
MNLPFVMVRLGRFGAENDITQTGEIDHISRLDENF